MRVGIREERPTGAGGHQSLPYKANGYPCGTIVHDTRVEGGALRRLIVALDMILRVIVACPRTRCTVHPA